MKNNKLPARQYKHPVKNNVNKYSSIDYEYIPGSDFADKEFIDIMPDSTFNSFQAKIRRRWNRATHSTIKFNHRRSSA